MLKLVWSIILFPVYALAFDHPIRESAYRPLNRDYAEYEIRELRRDHTEYEIRELSRENNHKQLRISAIRSARKYSENDLPEATPWRSMRDMQERFEEIRDERFLIHPSEPDFPRRISWLYPKDGCFARAAMFNRNAFRKFIPIPKKVFAFGNLRVKTPNARRGVVGWWYHVAPIVEVNGQKFVLDPSIDYEKPLTLNEWLAKMGNPERMKVAICDSGTYSPGDDCRKKTDGLELRAERTQMHYLKLEKNELNRMGRDPESELGEKPPWH